MPAIIVATNNCNIGYIDWLSSHGMGSINDMRDALYTAMTAPDYNYWNCSVPKQIKYADPQGGMLLFAQGSEHKVTTRPYAHNLKKLIEQEGLGEVIELPPVKNPLHQNKPGILFVWILNHTALRKWYAEEKKRLELGLPIPEPKSKPKPVEPAPIKAEKPIKKRAPKKKEIDK